jgi:hypothetical protein
VPLVVSSRYVMANGHSLNRKPHRRLRVSGQFSSRKSKKPTKQMNSSFWIGRSGHRPQSRNQLTISRDEFADNRVRQPQFFPDRNRIVVV